MEPSKVEKFIRKKEIGKPVLPEFASTFSKVFPPGYRWMVSRYCEGDPIRIDFVEKNWEFSQLAFHYCIGQIDDRTTFKKTIIETT